MKLFESENSCQLVWSRMVVNKADLSAGVPGEGKDLAETRRFQRRFSHQSLPPVLPPSSQSVGAKWVKAFVIR
jgi:hypothetical protein